MVTGPDALFAYLPTFKFQIEEQMREKNLKRGTFLNFLYITIQRLLQKQEHMIKSFSFLLRKEELFLQKRNSWQVCLWTLYHEWSLEQRGHCSIVTDYWVTDKALPYLLADALSGLSTARSASQ